MRPDITARIAATQKPKQRYSNYSQGHRLEVIGIHKGE